MKNITDLIYKEFKLVVHPTSFIFLILSAMLMIPSYPYCVVTFYACLGIFFTFLNSRENKDLYYMSILPIRKKDAAIARCTTVFIIELVQILVMIPFAILSVRINPNEAGNLAGMEANPAFFGLTFIGFAIFNAAFITRFYKTGYNAGSSFIWGCTYFAVWCVIEEIVIQIVPALKANLDTTDPAKLPIQFVVLLLGIVIYVVLNIWTVRKSSENFEKVDL